MLHSRVCGMICILALLYPLVTAIKPSDVKMAMAKAQGYFLLLSWSSVLTSRVRVLRHALLPGPYLAPCTSSCIIAWPLLAPVSLGCLIILCVAAENLVAVGDTGVSNPDERTVSRSILL